LSEQDFAIMNNFFDDLWHSQVLQFKTTDFWKDGWKPHPEETCIICQMILGTWIKHHCKKHKTHESTCKKCEWWTKHGKCQKRNPVDKDKLYSETVQHYMKGKDPNNQEDLQKANSIAQTVVQRAIDLEKEFAS